MKKTILILTLIALVFVMGCSTNNTKNQPTVENTFMGGSQGVIASFNTMGTDMNGMDTVWNGTNFDVSVEVKNKGEYTIPKGDLKVTIQGVDTNLFHLLNPEKTNSVDLEKISQYNKMGGDEIIDFGNARLDSIVGNSYTANFFASVVYKYQTVITVPNVCFKENYQDQSICNIEGQKEAYASGAPITLTQVTEEPSGKGIIMVKFDVENVGGGQVTLPNSTFNSNYDQLNFKLVNRNDNKITFTCTSSGSPTSLRFGSDKKGTIICKSSRMPVGTLYTKQLTMELDYKYKQLIQKTVQIKNQGQ